MMQVEWTPIILEIVEKLKSCYHPLKIVLFGSYARHEEVEDSDIDILIIARTDQRPVDRFVEVKRILYDPKNRIPISPLILNPGEITRLLESGNDYINEILSEGEIIYDTEESF
jgi:uncharacterized protein